MKSILTILLILFTCSTVSGKEVSIGEWDTDSDEVTIIPESYKDAENRWHIVYRVEGNHNEFIYAYDNKRPNKKPLRITHEIPICAFAKADLILLKDRQIPFLLVVWGNGAHGQVMWIFDLDRFSDTPVFGWTSAWAFENYEIKDGVLVVKGSGYGKSSMTPPPTEIITWHPDTGKTKEVIPYSDVKTYTVKGHFTSKDKQQEMKIILDSTDFYFQELKVLLDGKEIETNGSSQTEFLGKCRSSHSGLDQIVFSQGDGGNVPADYVFMYYDQEAKTFKDHTVDCIAEMEESYKSLFFDCPENQEERPSSCICRWEGVLAREQEGKAIYKRLRPTDKVVVINKTRNQSLPVRDIINREFSSILKKINAFNDVRFQIYEKENKNWELVVISFEQVWSSWGVVLVRKKGADTWKSFFDVPEGDSKIFLYYPKFTFMGNSLEASLCTDTAAGFFRDFIVDLDDMTISVP